MPIESVIPGLASPARVVNEFTVPASIPGNIRKVGLVEISADDEIAAEERGRGSNEKKSAELCKACIASVNGKTVGLGDGSADAAWRDMHPKLRTLINTAYVKMNLATNDEAKSFLDSRAAVV
jgi:hypothetical protein